MIMKMGFVLQAARTTVDVIERNGFKCVLVGPIAGYLHGSRTAPEDVTLVPLPNADGRPSTPESIAQLLQTSQPFHFRNVLHQAGATSTLRYYASDRDPHFCTIHLLRITNTSPISVPDIVRLRNLPTAPLIHILVDHLRTMLTSLEKNPGTMDRPSECPSPQVLTLNNLLLAAKDKSLTGSPSNTLFNQDATSVLQRASHLLPQFSTVLMTTAAVSTPFSVNPSAGSLPSTPRSSTTPPTEEAFINSLDEIDSDWQESVVIPALTSEPPIDPHTQTICRITKKVVQLLHDHLQVHSALFGSAACWLYGNTRVPDDIDLLVFPPPDLPREHLKQILQQTHPRRLRLERPANPDAPFKILYFHLDGINGPRGFFPSNKCKIDILTPGILHLPHLPPSQILHLRGLPVVPFALLLLQKLQGWDDHRKLRWTYPKKYAKATIDARDLEQLLALEEHVAPLRVSRPWNDESLFTEEFRVLSRQRVRDFCDCFPSCRRDFELLGLFGNP